MVARAKRSKSKRPRAARSDEPNRTPAMGRRAGGHVLFEAPDLGALWRAIAPRQGRYADVLLYPVVLRITFTYRGGRGALGDEPRWHAAEPAVDDDVATIKELLVKHGYVAHLAELALCVVAKRCGATPGVRVYARTLLQPNDVGHELPVDQLGEVLLLSPSAHATAFDAGERPLPFQPSDQVAPPPTKAERR